MLKYTRSVISEKSKSFIAGLVRGIEIFTITGDDLRNLWLRALDPKGLSLVPVEEFKEFLERIARGSMSN